MTTALLSYPRSGNTWCRYLIEAASGQPTWGFRGGVPREGVIGEVYPDLNVDHLGQPIVRKRHLWEMEPLPESSVILILRDPLEVIRRWPANPGKHSLELYAHIVREAFRCPRRCVVSFEELMRPDIIPVLQRLSRFLRFPLKRVADIQAKLDWHKNRSRELYATFDTYPEDYFLSPEERAQWIQWFRESDICQYLPFTWAQAPEEP